MRVERTIKAAWTERTRTNMKPDGSCFTRLFKQDRTDKGTLGEGSGAKVGWKLGNFGMKSGLHTPKLWSNLRVLSKEQLGHIIKESDKCVKQRQNNLNVWAGGKRHLEFDAHESETERVGRDGEGEDGGRGYEEGEIEKSNNSYTKALKTGHRHR